MQETSLECNAKRSRKIAERSFLSNAAIGVRPAWALTNEVKVLCRKFTVENHVVIRR